MYSSQVKQQSAPQLPTLRCCSLIFCPLFVKVVSTGLYISAGSSHNSWMVVDVSDSIPSAQVSLGNRVRIKRLSLSVIFSSAVPGSISRVLMVRGSAIGLNFLINFSNCCFRLTLTLGNGFLPLTAAFL